MIRIQPTDGPKIIARSFTTNPPIEIFQQRQERHLKTRNESSKQRDGDHHASNQRTITLDEHKHPRSKIYWIIWLCRPRRDASPVEHRSKVSRPKIKLKPNPDLWRPAPYMRAGTTRLDQARLDMPKPTTIKIKDLNNKIAARPALRTTTCGVSCCPSSC